MRFNLIVRGKLALYASWIHDETPEHLRAYRPPILFRSINPTAVGHYADDVSTRIAYHTYHESARTLKLRYPEIAKLRLMRDKNATDKLRFTDYWEMDAGGTVWNCHLIDDKEFLREPVASRLPLIPIIVRAAETFSLDPNAPNIQSGIDKPEIASEAVISLLDDILGEWETENVLESMLVTGIKEHFWPAKYFRNNSGAEMPDLELGADAINELPPGVEFVDPPPFTPDYQSATMIAERTHRRIERGGFPDANFGQAEASARSGFLFNQLAQAGQGVIGSITGALARTMMEANTLALCMIDKFSTDELTVYAYDQRNKETTAYTLGAEQTTDRYNNHVTIKPAKSPNDLQMAALGLQMLSAKVLSRRTFQQEMVPFELPDDEEEQIYLEGALDDPDLRKERIREEFFEEYGYELPPSEPDFQATPEQQMPPGGAPMDLQPPQAFPGQALPPQAQGQFAPEDMTGNADVDPATFAAMMGQGMPGGMMA